MKFAEERTYPCEVGLGANTFLCTVYAVGVERGYLLLGHIDHFLSFYAMSIAWGSDSQAGSRCSPSSLAQTNESSQYPPMGIRVY